ncbi:MAG: HD domain-containing protein [Candidatus Omnitrophota bacterium]|jgi:HD-GYP domain-containing protein (c-di-GMP phosphodiesterase class II)|nr:MAG: HD domain-containing protein [Candidatus Omnitrophota bacterium]
MIFLALRCDSLTVTGNTRPTLYKPSSTDEFVLPQDGDILEYITLDPAFLLADKVCGFPIYLYHPGRDRFVLFKSDGTKISQDTLEILSKGGRRPVFVPRANSYELNHYLSENLTKIVEDPNVQVEEKTQKFHTMAQMVMKSLFESPPDMDSFLVTSKNVSDSIAMLLTTEPQAILLLNNLRSYDYYTYSHSMNVCVLSVGLFQEIQKKCTPDHVRDLSRGVLLHDIGKCDIPTELTNKRGPLSEAEWEIMRSHTTKGFQRLMDDSEMTDDTRYVALYHHEAVDGSGYPTGKKNDQLPLTSRICKVVDVYDALTSKRSYKDGMTPFEALQIMTKEMKSKLDQDILKEFVLFLQKMGKLRVRRAG